MYRIMLVWQSWLRRLGLFMTSDYVVYPRIFLFIFLLLLMVAS